MDSIHISCQCLFHSKAQDLEQNQTVLQSAAVADILWKVIGQSSDELLENLGIIRYLCVYQQYVFQNNISFPLSQFYNPS